MNTRVNSYERKRGIDSTQVDIEGATESLADAASGRGIEIDTDRVISTAAIDEESFMRDELEIILMEPGNENEAGFAEVTVNGDYKILFRNGEPQKCRRYHVAVLAQAKQSRVRQKKIVAPDGSMGFQEESVLSLTYPFSIFNDPNPKLGGPWLRKLLQQPV
jgi:hypothetical protein